MESYGWLTESSIIPTPAKKINASAETLIPLTSTIAEDKLELQKRKLEDETPYRKPTKKAKSRAERVFDDVNPGVKTRGARDQLDGDNKIGPSFDIVSRQLETKAQQYEEFMNTGDWDPKKDGNKIKGLNQLVDVTARQLLLVQHCVGSNGSLSKASKEEHPNFPHDEKKSIQTLNLSADSTKNSSRRNKLKSRLDKLRQQGEQ